MRGIVIAAFAALCVACAGRYPQPVATVQPTDAMATCAMIVAEIEANNIKVKSLQERRAPRSLRTSLLAWRA
jgi:hypothetical protein